MGHFWVKGDYHNSLDSNTFGAVPLGLLTAKATHVVWPPRSWRQLKTENKRQLIKINKSGSLKS